MTGNKYRSHLWESDLARFELVNETSQLFMLGTHRAVLAFELWLLNMKMCSGMGLYRLACQLDLEGIVCKRADSPYLRCPLPDTRLIQFVVDALIPRVGLGTGHGTVGDEMLFKDVLDFCPGLTAFPLRELADSFDDPTANPDFESAALIRAELGAVFPDTICGSHWFLPDC
jgi:hypothetical protein